VGLKNVIVVLSADHGVASTPEYDQAAKLPGGRLSGDVDAIVSQALDQKFGKAKWLIPGDGETALYFDQETLQAKHVSLQDVSRTAKDALFATPELHVARVYTRHQLDNGIAGDFIAQAEMNGYFPRRSGDLHIIFEPGDIPAKTGTTHFSPYAYDRHVPVVFMGPGIKPGRYHETVLPNDVAPTLATMLDIQTPSGSSGRVLVEMLSR
jgi:arylsulfatase A-like enzyme